MSVLTHVVLITDWDPEDEPVKKLNDFLAKRNEGQRLEPLYVCDHSKKWPTTGGSKVFCDGVYAACFNFLKVDELINAFTGFGWDDDSYMGEATILAYRHEGDDEWHAILGNGAPAAHKTPIKKEDFKVADAGWKLQKDMYEALQLWTALPEEKRSPELSEVMSKIASSYATFDQTIRRIYAR